MIANRPPADRDLRDHDLRREEVLALLDAAEDVDLHPRLAALPARRGLLARHRIPLLVAASVAALTTGIAVNLSDDDARSHHAPPAASGKASAASTESPVPVVKPPTLPAGMLPVPEGRAISEALARDFVYRCVLTLPGGDGRPQAAAAARFRPYLAVRTPRPGRPDLYFATAVDDRGQMVDCHGDAAPDSTPSPDSSSRDGAWMIGPVEVLEGGQTLQGRWTTEGWGRYSGRVTRVTMDYGRGEQDALMAGGIWYATGSSARAGDPEPAEDNRIRGYDASGALVWDSAKDHIRGATDCARTPDGRILGYVAPPQRMLAQACPPAVPWTAGEPNPR
ncbi:hypothetical protein B4N89_47080 [Embleya scabrispora]|uniref:Uncharacterized protein n=1 Tax=Embleya scabrispora TaxID=159449 RepID=A0A1T3NJ01_9ACTN|nr:hypothetical protein [Embleya scabrispora]OPC76571.1 hypothetical protein B4N89_47080 [Embleya scabrispora]